MGNADGQEYPRDRVGEKGQLSPQRVGLGGAGGAVKDAGVVGPRARAGTVVLGARLGSGGEVVDESTDGY